MEGFLLNRYSLIRFGNPSREQRDSDSVLLLDPAQGIEQAKGVGIVETLAVQASLFAPQDFQEGQTRDVVHLLRASLRGFRLVRKDVVHRRSPFQGFKVSDHSRLSRAVDGGISWEVNPRVQVLAKDQGVLPD